MSRRDDLWVLQCARDLLGELGGERAAARELPPTRLTAGVLARFVLLRAAQAEPGTLTGKADDRVLGAALGSLCDDELTDPVAVLATDLVADVSAPVRCGRQTHTVTLRSSGEVVLVDHPGLDLVLERAAAALGGALPACVAVHDDVARRWDPPVADDGPLLGGVGAGELLAFVVRCRAWLAQGVDLLDARLALDRGIEPAAIREHLAAGLDVPTSVSFVRHPPAEAVRWVSLGMTADDSEVWRSQGRGLVDAEEVLAAGGTGRVLARWARVTGPEVSSDDLGEWARFGPPVGVWGQVARMGVRVAEVRPWLAAGVEPVEVLRYLEAGVGVAVALAWKEAGFNAFVATGHLAAGVPLAAALALREVPARAVQDLWRRHGSVEKVLAAL